MKAAVLALAAVLAAGAVSAQTTEPVPNAPSSPPNAPAGSGTAPQPRYGDAVHPYELRPGDRIRVWDASGALDDEDGTIVGTDLGGITATLDGRVRLLRFGEIRQMRTRRGTGHWKLGAVAGFVVGSVIYAVRDEQSEDPTSDFALLAGTFTAFGALAGNYALRPGWKPVDMAAVPTGPQSPDLHDTPRPKTEGRLAPTRQSGLRVSLRF